jgi:predicted nuclease of restriction endonuclease-like RecB superfamily
LLPTNLLRARTAKGQIYPLYADLDDENLRLAEKLIKLFQGHVGKRKGELLDEVTAFEMTGFDYRLVRGLSMTLQRLCNFQPESAVNPQEARKAIFEEASRRELAATDEMRKEILESAAKRVNVPLDQLEEAFYADLDEELILKDYRAIPATELLKRYNLSLTQTLLFRATYIDVEVSDHWKEILRQIKFRGLMYSAETRNGAFHITVEGPLSIFKLTRRYGTSIAKILPTIVQSSRWEINGNIVRIGESGKRLYKMRLTSAQTGEKARPASVLKNVNEAMFDSSVEERFFSDFQALHSGWRITREPSPLIAGRHVLIPDFSFEKAGVKVYMEIVGFWTREYLERKIEKLQLIKEIDMLVAADEKLACDKLRRAKGKVIFYKTKVPLRPILDFLKVKEETVLQREIQDFDASHLSLEGDLVKLQKIAEQAGISEEALRRKLPFHVDGYTLAGNLFVSNRKLKEIDLKLSTMDNLSLSQAINLLEEEGVKTPYDVLSALEYSIRWNGLDPKNSSICKKQR